MTKRFTNSMVADAEKSGGKVQLIRKPQPAPKPKPKPPQLEPAPPNHAPELKALRDEISKLRAELEETKSAAERRTQELSAIIAGMAEDKPFAIDPVREMDPKKPNYLLVKRYLYKPVKYRKLDS